MPNPPPEPSVAFLHRQAEEAKVAISETVMATYERSSKVEVLEQKAEELAIDAAMFAKTAKKAKEKMWWENTKVKIGLIALILLILLLIIIPLAIPSSSQEQ